MDKVLYAVADNRVNTVKCMNITVPYSAVALAAELARSKIFTYLWLNFGNDILGLYGLNIHVAEREIWLSQRHTPRLSVLRY